MRRRRCVLAIGLALAALPVGRASAQVTTNTDALKGLGAPAPAHHAAAHRPVARATHAAPYARHAERSSHERARPGPAAGTHAAVPTMPAHPPPVPVIAPPAIHVPLHPPAPPPPVPVDRTAKGTVARASGGITILDFGSGSAGLNAAMMAAVKAATADILAHPADIAVIDSDAAGSADDPSMPRRLSLQRALAIRAVMINGGVPSTRIFARADGAPDGAPNGEGVEPDRTTISERDGSAPGAFAPVPATGATASAEPASAEDAASRGASSGSVRNGAPSASTTDGLASPDSTEGVAAPAKGRHGP